MRKQDLRLWAVWDPVVSRIEISSESQTACRNVMALYAKNGRTGLELLRFDLSPLYYDVPRISEHTPLVRGLSISGVKPGKQKNNNNKQK